MNSLAILALLLAAATAQSICPTYTCVREGGSCSGIGAQCEAGTYCTFFLQNCNAVKTSGTCSSSVECGDQSDLTQTYACIAGSCQRYSAPGDPCTSSTECQGSAACVGGICQVLALGAACTGTYDARLAFDTYCENGTVFASKPTGSFCDVANADRDCKLQDYCLAGVCTAPYNRAAGATCTRPNSCAWGLSCIAGICGTPGTGTKICNQTITDDCNSIAGSSCDCNGMGAFMCHAQPPNNCATEYQAAVDCVTANGCAIYGRTNCPLRTCRSQYFCAFACISADPFYTSEPCGYEYECDASFLSLGLVLLMAIAFLL